MSENLMVVGVWHTTQSVLVNTVFLFCFVLFSRCLTLDNGPTKDSVSPRAERGFQ